MSGQNVWMPESEADQIDREFLVTYDYGMGGLWAVIMAPSTEAIRTKYPELSVAAERPPWMDDERYEKLRSEHLWLNDPPTGILVALVAERG
jgi:hypothetical protein